MPYIEVNGIKTNYVDEGTGECILILHGWGASIETFRPVIDYFKNKNRVVALDMPGCGKTEEPSAAYCMNDYAAFVNTFRELLGIQNPVLMGHSNGGRTILKLFSQNPSYPCKKVILIDASGIKHKRSFAASVKLYSYKTVKAVLQCPIWKKAAASLKRSGLLLADEDILHAMNDELSPAFLAGIKKENFKIMRSARRITTIVPKHSLA